MIPAILLGAVGAIVGRDRAGLAPLFLRRLRVAVKSIPGLVGTLVTPVLWVLVAGARRVPRNLRSAHRLLHLRRAQPVVLLVPFVSMFAGINVIVDKDFGVLRDLLVAPIHRRTIPVANALGVLMINWVQVGIIIGLAIAYGAQLDTSLSRFVWLLAGVSLLSAGTYGLAELLAYRVGRQEAYGPLIPAVGVTPFMLCGGVYPLAVLPTAIRWFAYGLPWTHAVALVRYALMGSADSGLRQIWGFGSTPVMAALSTAVLAAFTALAWSAAMRAFRHATTS